MTKVWVDLCEAYKGVCLDEHTVVTCDFELHNKNESQIRLRDKIKDKIDPDDLSYIYKGLPVSWKNKCCIVLKNPTRLKSGGLLVKIRDIDNDSDHNVMSSSLLYRMQASFENMTIDSKNFIQTIRAEGYKITQIENRNFMVPANSPDKGVVINPQLIRKRKLVEDAICHEINTNSVPTPVREATILPSANCFDVNINRLVITCEASDMMTFTPAARNLNTELIRLGLQKYELFMLENGWDDYEWFVKIGQEHRYLIGKNQINMLEGHAHRFMLNWGETL